MKGKMDMSIEPGKKLYSYCYGQMTVKSVDANYITVSVDNPDGFSGEFATLCKNRNLDDIRFMTASLGHWCFESANDVLAKKENNDFPEAQKQSGFPHALTRNEDYLHADFRKGGDTYPQKKVVSDTFPVEKKGGDTFPVEKR